MRKRAGSKGDGEATGRPQRAGRRTRGKASQMLAHLEGLLNKGKTVLRIWKAGRPTGSFDFDVPPPLASALRPAGGWPHCQGSPGYGLEHDDERQNREMGR